MSTERYFKIRPRARLMSVLGEDMIRDQAVGLIELVKNSYDADATLVEIQLQNLKRGPDETTIIVSDNGSGMSLEDIEGKWLSPAVAHKEQAKRNRQRSALGRLPIGEKGVGRFAVQQIGRNLTIVTRAKNEPEIVVEIDWDQFSDETQYLEDIPINVVERDPQVFVGNSTGTVLTMSRARTAWNETLLKKVQRTLRRLQNPLPQEELGFTVRVTCPDYPDYQNVDPTDLLDRAHYEFRVLVMEDGTCDFEYVCKHPALQGRAISDSTNLLALARDRVQGSQPKCGQFYLNLYVWDRTASYLTQSKVTRPELDAHCGVSLYRDGLRVLPYGDPGDDWLFLDQDRIQNTDRIGNNQVIGLVMVDQSTNLALRDKTNREGLIENEAFQDLRILTRAAISLFTSHWKNDRPSDMSPVPGQSHSTSMTQVKETATAIRGSASDNIRVTIPPKPQTVEPVGVKPPDVGPVDPSGTRTPTVDISQREAVDILISELEGVQSSFQERERQLQVLMHLAATGMAAERVAHEFGRQVTAAFTALGELKSSGNIGLLTPFRVLETCLTTLRNELRLLAPFETIRRAEPSKELSVRDVAKLALTLNQNIPGFTSVEWSIEGQDFNAKAREGSVAQAIDNLMNNAAYWASTRNQARVGIVLVPSHKAVLIVDNGPGVHKEAIPNLGKPFFSMKADGRGLGLYIATELMKTIGGRVSLAGADFEQHVPEWATGATFLIEFPN